MSEVRLIDANALEKTAIPCETHNGALTELCVPLYQIRTAPTLPNPCGSPCNFIGVTEEQAIDKLHETGWMQKHDKEITTRPTGKWIETAKEYYEAVNERGGGVDEHTPYFVDDIACPKCLAMFSTIDNETERFNYCPKCGAKMKEAEND